jgi:hypothetical protein
MRSSIATMPRREKSERPNAIVPPSAPVWHGEEYPRIESGRRVVCVHHLQGPVWVRAFRRWSLRLECLTVDEPGRVSGFLNLGGDKDKLQIPGRQSNYFKVWSMANGGPPRKGQSLEWEILIDKWFRVQIEKCTHNSKGEPKPDSDVYSRITEFLELTGPRLP